MVKIQQGSQGVKSDAAPVSYREPIRSQLVFAPSYPLLYADLHRRLAQRQLTASHDGSHVAAVIRKMGSSCSIAHSSPNFLLPNLTFGEAMVLRVHSDMAVEVWADYEGTRGIWMLKANVAPRLTARLDRVESVIPSRLGTIVIGALGDAQRHYVVRDVTVIVPDGAKIVMDGKGHSHGMLPLGNGMRRSWIRPPAYDCRIASDEAGPPIFPLPFLAERVDPFLLHGRLMCILRDGTSDALWREVESRHGGRVRSEGILTDMAIDGTDAGIDFAWPSPDTSEHVMLLRIPNKDGGFSRRLLLNSVRRVHEGAFCMREDDFRWSPDGSHFVAHLRLLDSDANQRNEMIVTKSGRRDVIRGMAYQPIVDDAGRVAYVLNDKTGWHVVAGSAMTSGYPYAWNVAHGDDCVTANVLVSGKIHRIELPYGR